MELWVSHSLRPACLPARSWRRDLWDDGSVGLSNKTGPFSASEQKVPFFRAFRTQELRARGGILFSRRAELDGSLRRLVNFLGRD